MMENQLTPDDRKFTDRDVRDDDGLVRIAYDYLQDYTGEFAFLVDMKMRALEFGDLSVGMVRGVLNCMRHDPRVTGLPRPGTPMKDYSSNEEGKVIQMRPKRTSETKALICRYFKTKVEHNAHSYQLEDGSRVHCNGWHKVNRRPFLTLRARFNTPYMRGVQSNLIHRCGRYGEVTWQVPAHRYGPGFIVSWRVRPVCPMQLMCSPILLDAKGVREQKPFDLKGTRHPKITLCSRCFPGTDMETL